MRALGLDLGAVRLGVALSDSRGAPASPCGAIVRSGELVRDHAAIAEAETGAEAVVVGLPLSMDGRMGPAARAAMAEVASLRAGLAVPVEVCDERLSTVSASRAMTAAGRSPRRQPAVIDSAAAAVVLQAWLDRRCTRGVTA
ncbi:MAG: Holliday junction resolvase RuvX [Acidimicrobiales bacterium]